MCFDRLVLPVFDLLAISNVITTLAVRSNLRFKLEGKDIEFRTESPGLFYDAGA